MSSVLFLLSFQSFFFPLFYLVSSCIPPCCFLIHHRTPSPQLFCCWDDLCQGSQCPSLLPTVPVSSSPEVQSGNFFTNRHLFLFIFLKLHRWLAAGSERSDVDIHSLVFAVVAQKGVSNCSGDHAFGLTLGGPSFGDLSPQDSRAVPL